MMKVCNHQCDQYLFGKNKIVSNSRRRDILKECVDQDTHFICHKGSIVDKDVVCAGFFERYSTNKIRIMGRLKAIQFVDPDVILMEGLKAGKISDDYI